MNTPVTVAILDDDILFAEALECLLKNYPEIRVLITAGSRKSFLEKITTVPDVLLLDLKLREESGLDLITGFLQSYPEMKVIALSAFYKPVYLAAALRNGFSAFLPKNVPSRELVDAIVAVKQKGVHFDVSDLSAMRNYLQHPSGTTDFGKTSLLSEREKEIVKLVCEQYSSSEIAAKLFLSVRTVEGHRNRIFEKTGLANTAGLIVYGLVTGIADADELALRYSLR